MSSKAKYALAAAVALVVVGAAYLKWGKREQASAGPVGATMYVVRRGSLRETASASGKIEPHVQVEVKSRASGEVWSAHVLKMKDQYRMPK